MLGGNGFPHRRPRSATTLFNQMEVYDLTLCHGSNLSTLRRRFIQRMQGLGTVFHRTSPAYTLLARYNITGIAYLVLCRNFVNSRQLRASSCSNVQLCSFLRRASTSYDPNLLSCSQFGPGHGDYKLLCQNASTSTMSRAAL